MTSTRRTEDAPRRVFYLVRHGEKLPSAADVGLSLRGREEAAAVAERIARESPTALYSSPLIRARETAAEIARATGLAVRLDPRLVERRLVHEMLSDDEFKDAWTRSERDRDFAPEGGESSRAAGRRLAEVLEQLAQRDRHQRAVVVTHGGVIRDLLRTLRDEASGAGGGYWTDVAIPSASVTTVFEAEDGQWSVGYVGSIPDDWSAE